MLARGFRFGGYEVSSLLGVGGMGEVYRARDAKLQRDVALKILPSEFLLDPDRCARFEREAQILAALNHPTIGAIYGLEDSQLPEAGGIAGKFARALVLELVEGPTLADELAAGGLPVTRALEIARQIADALEAAHDRGIVHRDLKPANVKVRPDDIVKVLDFGLAKTLESPTAATSGNAPNPRTPTPAPTEVGAIFGTPEYMSPEQVRGRAADQRSDIWAFGCILYEMLTGRRPFAADEPAEETAAVLRAEPDWAALPSDLPSPALRLLRRCLAKDRTRRLRDIGDARLEIDDALAAREQAGEPARRGTLRFAWFAGAIALAAVAAYGGALLTADRAQPAGEMRLDVHTPDTPNAASFAIAPDARSLVFSAIGPDGPQLWLRTLDSAEPQPLAGTEEGQYPFWSPDGRSIGFFTLNALKRIDLDGASAQTLAPTVTPGGGTWGPQDTILYVPMDNGGVFRIPASGGESVRVTPDPTPGSPPLATRAPQFLPDGRRFLFYVGLEDESAGVYIGDIESGAIRRILAADTPAMYGAGHLWFVNDATLFAQAFDPATLELSGPVTRIANDVSVEAAVAAVSTSAAGPIAFRTGARTLLRQLVWVDRAGRRLDTVGEEYVRVNNPTLSPDGRQLLVQQTVRQNVDVWLIDLEREVRTRLTQSPTVDSIPTWSPDGSRFVQNTSTPDGRVLLIQSLDGSRANEVLATFTDNITLTNSWAPNGQYVLATTLDPAAGTWDVRALSVAADRPSLQLTATPLYDERNAEFSPDGAWFAFESNESGTREIYVRAFPGPGPNKVRVSTSGGRQARWRRDGTELFYVELDNTMMAVPVAWTDGRPTFGAPSALFEARMIPTIAINRQQYVVSADGQRFLLVAPEDAPTPPITLLMNWRPPSGR